MKKLLILCLLSLAWVTLLKAQTTVVSGTVTDSDGTLWTYGTVTVEFVPNPSNPNVAAYNINGTPLSGSTLYQGPLSLSAGGNFSLTVYDNTFVTPVGSQWKYTICPNATSIYGCGIFTTGAAGATQNITSTISAFIKAPRFGPVSGQYGYVDAEAAYNLVPGSTYWNVTSLTQRYWNGAAWISFGGGGGGSVANFIANPSNWPAWLVPSVANPTTTPSLSVTASPIPNSALQYNALTLGTTNISLGATVTALDGLTSIQSFAYDAPSGNSVIVQPGASSTNDLEVLNAAGSANNLTVDDAGDIIGAVGDILIPPTATTYWGPASGGILLASAAPTGSGAPVEQTSPQINNGLGTTQASSDTSTLLATDAYVHNVLAAISAGVITINGDSGNFTFPAFTCTGTAPNWTCSVAVNVPDVNLTIPALTIAANTCVGPNGIASPITPGTISMPGVTTAMGIAPTWQGDPYLTVGWGKVGGLSLKVWPDTGGGQADWVVCNPTAASITSNSTGVRLLAQ
jgi:hypothetical protein